MAEVVVGQTPPAMVGRVAARQVAISMPVEAMVHLEQPDLMSRGVQVVAHPTAAPAVVQDTAYLPEAQYPVEVVQVEAVPTAHLVAQALPG